VVVLAHGICIIAVETKQNTAPPWF